MIQPTPAERILLSLGIDRAEDIDLEAIALTRGAVVRYRALDGCEACIVGGARKAIISIKAGSHPRRQRFSLAHELGHWHFHRGRTLYCGHADIGNPAKGPLDPERQADDFASDLILPNYLFRPAALRMKRLTLDAAREIAEPFKASLTATLIKIAKLNRFPVVVVGFHRTRGRRWFSTAPMVPGWWRLRPDLDRETFAHATLFGTGAEETLARKVDGDAFFDFRNAADHGVREQSFRVSDDEIVTLLTLPDTGLA